MASRTLIVKVLPQGFKELAVAVDGLGKSSGAATTSIKSVGAAAQNVDERVSKYAQRMASYAASLKSYATQITQIAAALKGVRLPTNLGDLGALSASGKELATTLKQIEKSGKSILDAQAAQQKALQERQRTLQQEQKTLQAIQKTREATARADATVSSPIKTKSQSTKSASNDALKEEMRLRKMLADTEKRALSESKTITNETNRLRKEAAELIRKEAAAEKAKAADARAAKKVAMEAVRVEKEREKEIKAAARTAKAAESQRLKDIKLIEKAARDAEKARDREARAAAKVQREADRERIRNIKEVEKAQKSAEAAARKELNDRKRAEREASAIAKKEAREIAQAKKEAARIAQESDPIFQQRMRIKLLEEKIDERSLNAKEKQLTLEKRILELENRRQFLKGDVFAGGSRPQNIQQGFVRGRELADVESQIKNVAKQMREVEKETHSARVGLLDWANIARIAFANIVAILSTEIIFGLRRLGGEIINAASALQDYQNKIRLVVKETQNFESTQSKLFSLAKETRTSFGGTIEIFTRMARATESLNISQERLFRITETVNKATIVSGANAREAEQGLIQLAQGIASNRLSGDEFRSISEQLPEITRIIADSLNVTRGELRLLASEGKLTAEVVIAALEGAADVIDAKFAKTRITIGQAFENLKTTAFERLAKDVDSISDVVVGFVGLLEKNIDNLINSFTALTKVAINLGIALASQAAWKAMQTSMGTAMMASLTLGAQLERIRKILSNPFILSLVIIPIGLDIINNLVESKLKIKADVEFIPPEDMEIITKEAKESAIGRAKEIADALKGSVAAERAEAVAYEAERTRLIKERIELNRLAAEEAQRLADEEVKSYKQQIKDIANNIPVARLFFAIPGFDEFAFNLGVISGKIKPEEIKAYAEQLAKANIEQQKAAALAEERRIQEEELFAALNRAAKKSQELAKFGINVSTDDLLKLNKEQLDGVNEILKTFENDLVAAQEKLKAGSAEELRITEKKLALLGDVTSLKDGELSVSENIAQQAAEVLDIYESYVDVLEQVLELQGSGLDDFKKNISSITEDLQKESRLIGAQISGGESARAKLELEFQYDDQLKEFEDDIKAALDRVGEIDIRATAKLTPEALNQLRMDVDNQLSKLQAVIDVQVKATEGLSDSSESVKNLKRLQESLNALKEIKKNLSPNLSVFLQVETMKTILLSSLGIAKDLTEEEKRRGEEIRKNNEDEARAINRQALQKEVRSLERQLAAAKISEEELEIQKKIEELRTQDLGIGEAALRNEAERIVAMQKQLALIEQINKARKEADKQFREDISELRNSFNFEIQRQRARTVGGDRGEVIFEREAELERILKTYEDALLNIEGLTADQIEENKRLISVRRAEIDAIKKTIPHMVLFLETMTRIADISVRFQEGIDNAFDSFFDTLVRKPKDAFKQLGNDILDSFKQLGADILKEVFNPLRESLRDFAKGIVESILQGGGFGDTLKGGFQGIFKSLKGIGSSIGGSVGKLGSQIGGAALPAAVGGFIGAKLGSGIGSLLGLKKGSDGRQFITGAFATGGALGGAALAGIGLGALGGPIGIAAAVIIGGLVSLFRGKPSNKFARGSLDLGTLAAGGFRQKDNSEDSNENAQAVKDFLGGLSDVLNSLKTIAGGKLVGDIVVEINKRDGIVIGTGGFGPGGGPNNPQAFKDPDAAFRSAVALALDKTTGADPIFTGFLRGSLYAGSKAEEITEGMQRLGNALAFLKEPTSQWKSALDEITSVFTPLIENAKAAGQSITEVSAAFEAAKTKLRVEFVKDANNQALAINNPVAATFQELVETMTQRITDARALGGDDVLSAAKNLNSAQLRKFFEDFSQGVDSIVESLDSSTVNETVQAIRDFKDGFAAIAAEAEAAGSGFAKVLEYLTDQFNDKLDLLRRKFDESIEDEILGFENPQALALKQILKEQQEAIAIAQELGANVDRVLDLTARRIQDLIEAAASDPESLVNLAEGMAMLIEQMEQAGQDIGPVIEAFAEAQEKVVKAFNDSVTDRILEITQPTLQAFKALLTKQKAELNIGGQIGADLVLLQQAQALERKKFLDDLSDEDLASLGDFLGLIEDFGGKIAVALQQVNNVIEDQTSSFRELADSAREASENLKSIAGNIRDTFEDIENRFNVGPPGERLANLRLKFQSTFEAAQAGDVSALEKLPELGNEIINQSRSLFGGTEAFQSDLDFVLGILKTSERIALEKAAQEQARSDAILKQVDLLTEIRDLLGTQGLKPEDLQVLVDQIDPANTGLLPLINQLLNLLYSNDTNLGSVTSFLTDQENAQNAINQLYEAAGLTPPAQSSSTPSPTVDTLASNAVNGTTQTTVSAEQFENMSILVALTEQTNDKLDEVLRAIRAETTVEENSEREQRRVRAALEKFVNEQMPQSLSIQREVANNTAN
jgi:tape measure domain-containing protein